MRQNSRPDENLLYRYISFFPEINFARERRKNSTRLNFFEGESSLCSVLPFPLPLSFVSLLSFPSPLLSLTSAPLAGKPTPLGPLSTLLSTSSSRPYLSLSAVLVSRSLRRIAVSPSLLGREERGESPSLSSPGSRRDPLRRHGLPSPLHLAPPRALSFQLRLDRPP